jgi:hypothetical protein
VNLNDRGQLHFVGCGRHRGGNGIDSDRGDLRQSQRIHELARRFMKLVKDARLQIEAWKKSQVLMEYTGAEKCEE